VADDESATTMTRIRKGCAMKNYHEDFPNTIPESAKSQRAAILRLLLDAKGSRIASPEIAAYALQYNARIFELRKLGFNIENRVQIDEETSTRCSWFRLVASPAVPAPKREPVRDADGNGPAPSQLLTKKTESDYMRRVREDEAKTLPLFAQAGVRP
jgi:hypothetical protein